MRNKTSLRLPGLIDVHVHLRVPGGEHKEDIRTGTAAALAGGFTTVLAMPNTHPPLVTSKDLHAACQQARREALCDVRYFAGASAEFTDELTAMSRDAVGLKIYMDETYGPLRVSSLLSLMACFRSWACAKPIAVHAEGRSVVVALGLATAFQKPVHVCHVSRKEEIALIVAAKQRGVPVTCEVTPHHLFLTEADGRALGWRAEVRPALATKEDVNALWTHLDDAIDCVATDHAPHTVAEKQAEGGSPGVPGLETALPLMLTAVVDERLTLERLVTLMSANPQRLFGLPNQPDTWVEVDVGRPHTIRDDRLETKCGWSPFSGMEVKGRVRRVQLRGRVVYEDGNITTRTSEML